MTFARLTLLALIVLLIPVSPQQSPQPDWSKIEEETMRHFQAILRLDTSDPPGNEGIVVEYLKSVLDREGIETKIFALDPKRPNLVPVQFIAYPVAGHSPGDPVRQQNVNRRWLEWLEKYLALSATSHLQ